MTDVKKSLQDYPIADLKRVYLALHDALATDPVLMDSELLHDLQQLLQGAARRGQIDATDHGQWDRWLHAPETGEDRHRRR